jgi:hypothetical protein
MIKCLRVYRWNLNLTRALWSLSSLLLARWTKTEISWASRKDFTVYPFFMAVIMVQQKMIEKLRAEVEEWEQRRSQP